MRMLIAAAFLALAGNAQAKVAITVDKDAQMLTVAVDGEPRYRWPVSTGNPSHETPNGQFRAFRMEKDHFSREFDSAPMPHSVFFTKQGHAIHGTTSERSLGIPVSHGCVRLSRENAATLYALVQEQGVLNTTVTLTGSSQVALARNPAAQRRAVARQPTPDDESYAVDGINVGQPTGRYGRVAMEAYDTPPRYRRRDLAPPIWPPEVYVQQPYAPSPGHYRLYGN